MEKDRFQLTDLRRLETDIFLLEKRIAYWESKIGMVKAQNYDALKVQRSVSADEQLVKNLHTKMELEKNRDDLLNLLRHKEAYFYKVTQLLVEPELKRVLVYRYIEGKRLLEIGNRLNLSERQARRLLMEAEKKFAAFSKTLPYTPI